MAGTFSCTVDGTGAYVRIPPDYIREKRLTDERPHMHTFLEFHYVYEGEELLFLPKDERRLSVPAGSIVMIPQGIYHCGETRGENSVRVFCFDFRVDPESGAGSALFESYRSVREARVFRDPFNTAAMDRFARILGEAESPMRENRIGTLLLGVIMDLLGRRPGDARAEKRQNNTKFRQKWLIEEYIITQYFAPEGLAGLAEKLYLSERQTRKLVRSFYGEDYKTLIVRQRMEIAQLYLESRTLSLEKIAEKIGYRSYSGFHLAFVRTFGITPGQYRAEHGGAEEEKEKKDGVPQ